MRVATIAVIVSIVDAIWGIAVGVAPSQTIQRSLVAPWDWLVIALAVLLLVGALISLTGIPAAFYASAALAVLVVIAVVVSERAALADTGILVTVVLGAAAVAADVLAVRMRPQISEENHPLNLPVFG